MKVVDSQDYFKLKSIYVTNEAINTVKKPDREGEAIFAKGVILKTYKEFEQLNS